MYNHNQDAMLKLKRAHFGSLLFQINRIVPISALARPDNAQVKALDMSNHSPGIVSHRWDGLKC